jgi:hypothetical protein
LRRTTWAGSLALLALLIFPLTAFAAYPPGTFPGPAPGGAYRTIVMSQIVCPAGGSMQASYDQSALTLEIPAGALSACTQVSIYVAEPGVVSPLLPAGALLVDGFAVGWDGSAPAGSALTLTVADAAITAGAKVFETTGSGLQPSAGATLAPGIVKLGFAMPFGLVVAIPGSLASSIPSPSGGVLGATGRPTMTPPATTTGPELGALPGGIAGPLVAFLLLSGLVLFIVLRRRRRRASSTD